MGSFTDRTGEFKEICRFLGAAERAQRASIERTAAGLTNKAEAGTERPEVASLAEFHTAASSISQEIFTTSQKVKGFERGGGHLRWPHVAEQTEGGAIDGKLHRFDPNQGRSPHTLLPKRGGQKQTDLPVLIRCLRASLEPTLPPCVPS